MAAKFIDRNKDGWPELSSLVELGFCTEDIMHAGTFLARFNNDADTACDLIRAVSELGEITNQTKDDDDD